MPPEESPERTYYEIARNSNVIALALVLSLLSMTWLWYIGTAQMAQSGVINQNMMIALRAPVLAVTILVWVWGFVTRITMIAE